MTVYRGEGQDPYRVARQTTRHAKRRANQTRTLVRALALLIVLTALVTRLVVQEARACQADRQLRAAITLNSTITNRLNTVQFELQRETKPENLSLKAKERLGMQQDQSDRSVQLPLRLARGD